MEAILLPRDVAIKALDCALRTADRDFRKTAATILSELKNPTADPLRFHMLGAFKVYQGERELGRACFRRAQAWKLISFLAHCFPNPVSHDTIMETFWPDCGEASAKRCIYTNLSCLCTTLEPGKERNAKSRYIHHRNGQIWLEPSAVKETDVVLFEGLCQEGEKELMRGHADKALGLLLKARGLYRGDYFEDELYSDWALSRRSHLEDRLLQLDERLAALFLLKGRVSDAISCLEEAFERDPFQERICCALMKAYHRAGMREKVHRCFSHLGENLRRELNIEPDAQTRLTYTQLISAS